MTESTDGSLEEIPADECYRLLATHEIGRLGVNADNHPLICPANSAMDGTTIVIRTRPDTELTAARHADVAFQVDQIDPSTHSGSSVLVCGVAEEVGEEHRADLVARTHATRCGRGRRVRPGTGCG